MKRVHITLSYLAEFDDDFDTALLQNMDQLIGFGVVSLLRKDPEQEVNVSDAKLALRFPDAKRRMRRRS